MGKAERRKALEYQAAVAKWLEDRGWRVVNLPIGGRWQAVRDIFGVDIIAKHPDRSATLWIQATADRKVSWRRKTARMITVPWNWHTDRVFIFKERGRNDWVVRRLTAQGLRPFSIVLLGTQIQAKGVRYEF